MASCSLQDKKCVPCEGGVAPLGSEEIELLLNGVNDWQRSGEGIERSFRFANHYEAVAFVNAVAWISHREDHHPEITLGYADVRVRYWTHAIGGLSENDFICAAKVDQLSRD